MLFSFPSCCGCRDATPQQEECYHVYPGPPCAAGRAVLWAGRPLKGARKNRTLQKATPKVWPVSGPRAGGEKHLRLAFNCVRIVSLDQSADSARADPRVERASCTCSTPLPPTFDCFPPAVSLQDSPAHHTALRYCGFVALAGRALPTEGPMPVFPFIFASEEWCTQNACQCPVRAGRRPACCKSIAGQLAWCSPNVGV